MMRLSWKRPLKLMEVQQRLLARQLVARSPLEEVRGKLAVLGRENGKATLLECRRVHGCLEDAGVNN